LLSEVSDSSGWTPWLVEVQYTASEVAKAQKIIKELMDKLKGVLPLEEKTWLVNTKSGKVEPEVSQNTNTPTACIFLSLLQ
jgi:hypothetical protein